MKLTVIIQDASHAAHIGGALEYRTVALELTPEQAEKLKLKNSYEIYSQAIIEGEKQNG